jgi:enamine deaminase RidA (YjgF/YER057c/UK114 family)
MDPIEEKLRALGLALPAAPAPAGSYVPYRIHGDALILSGVLCVRDGAVTHAGQVGRDQTVESGREAARVCALNALAATKSALGRLDRVREFLLVSGYVNGVAGFAESPQVVNGASDLFVELYGEAGKHARAAVAVAGLPRNASVEIQVTLRFKGGPVSPGLGGFPANNT